MKNGMVLWIQTVVTVSVVNLHDRVAGWGLQLTADAQRHETGSYHLPLAWEKIKIESMVCTECVSLSRHCKVK